MGLLFMKHVQGFAFSHHVKSQDSVLYIIGNGEKLTVDTVEAVEDRYVLKATAEATKDWPVGEYKYQILDANGIAEEGDFTVLRNFALSSEEDEVKSRDELILEAIEAQLAGRATSAQSSMSVGDKSISYMSIDELLKLRSYFKEKVDKEKGTYSTGSAGRIKYVWKVR